MIEGSNFGGIVKSESPFRGDVKMDWVLRVKASSGQCDFGRGDKYYLIDYFGGKL